MADRRRLLLDPGISAWNCAAGGRRAGGARHGRPGGRHAAGRGPDLCRGRAAILCRTRIDRAAGKLVLRLDEQDPGAGSARLRRHRFRHHHDALGRRRSQARHRQSLSAPLRRQLADENHAHPAAAAGHRLSRRISRGHTRCQLHRHSLPLPESHRAAVVWRKNSLPR